MTFGTSFHNGDKSRLAGEDYSRPCSNASPEEGILNGVGGGGGGLGAKLKCPASISRLRVEKIEGGLMVAGVVVAANCQIALPAFGFLFVLVGAVLTAASYRGPGEDEDKDSYAARIAFTGNSRILGPICIVVGALMLALGALLCALTRRARRRERRVGFHCPLHGDFYPLSPAQGAKMLGKNVGGWTKMPCFRGRAGAATNAGNGLMTGKFGSRIGPPQCPHSVLSSTRSSVSSSPLSPCPTPMPFLVTSGSMSSGMVQISAGANLSPDQTFGSIRSLSVTREVASFPLSRTPTPPPQHRPVSNLPNNSSSSGTDDGSTTALGPGSVIDSPAKNVAAPVSGPRPEIRVLAPSHRPESLDVEAPSPPLPTSTTTTTTTTSGRKSVSIVLPDEPLG